MRTASGIDRLGKRSIPTLINFWKPDPHPGGTPRIGVNGTQTIYALCFARSMSSF
jgi:hypothetical protein